MHPLLSGLAFMAIFTISGPVHSQEPNYPTGFTQCGSFDCCPPGYYCGSDYSSCHKNDSAGKVVKSIPPTPIKKL